MITRLDVVVLIFWQVLLIFNVQQLYPIFLNFMPSHKCEGVRPENALCYAVVDKCNKCIGECSRNALENVSEQQCRAIEGLNQAECFTEIRTKLVFSSAAYEYGYFCNKNLRFIRPDTAQYVGVLLGAIFFGILSDVYGRRQILLISISLGILSLFLSGEMVHVAWFYSTRFLVGLFSGGGIVVGWSYVTELISAKKRMLLRVISSWPLARLIIAFVCYTTGEWRGATRVLVLLSLPIIPFLYFVLPESHVWLASQGQRRLYDQSIDRLNLLAGFEYIRKSNHDFVSKADRVGFKEGLKQIFMNSTLRRRMLVLFSFWFVTFYSYYIIHLNSDTMSNNFFLGQFLLSGLLVAMKLVLGSLDYFVPGMNRRRLHLVAQAVFILFVVIIMSLYLGGMKSSTVFMLCWFGAAIFLDYCADVCYLIVSELMPTEVRGAASGASSMVARVGSILSTLTMALGNHSEHALYIIVIVLSIGNWLVSFFFLDESKGADLLEVAREAMKVRKQSKFTRKQSHEKNYDHQIRVKRENTTPEHDVFDLNNLNAYWNSAWNPGYDWENKDNSDDKPSISGAKSDSTQSTTFDNSGELSCKDGVCSLRQPDENNVSQSSGYDQEIDLNDENSDEESPKVVHF